MERIGAEVEKTLRRSGGGAALALAEITSAWPSAVGETIARNAWPLRMGRERTLHVATTSATWAFELDRMSPEIAERLAAVLCEHGLGEHAPAGFRFRAGPVPEPGSGTSGTVTEGENSAPAIDPHVASEADAAAAAIEDPELRELVARAARASLARPSSGRRF